MSQRWLASLHTSIGASPSGPLVLGSTTCNVKPAAAAASNALPPFSRMLMPTAEASQWVEATTPNVPRISGRVVKPGIACSPDVSFVNGKLDEVPRRRNHWAIATGANHLIYVSRRPLSGAPADLLRQWTRACR